MDSPAATEREILELTENRMVEEEVEFDSVNNKLVAAKLESYTNCNGDLKSSKAYQEKMVIDYIYIYIYIDQEENSDKRSS